MAHQSILVLVAISLLAILYFLHIFSSNPRIGWVAIHDESQVSEGYVLLAPYILQSHYEEPGVVQLIDEEGVLVHEWHTRYQVLRAILTDDSHLFVSLIEPGNLMAKPGGKTGLIQELDWEGNVLWEYRDEEMNHDFTVLPNGDIAYLRWEELSESFANRIRGGKESDHRFVSEEIVVINKNKETIWTWSLKDYVDPDSYALHPEIPRSEWTHSNSLQYRDTNPITQKPVFVLSARNIDTVLMIDAASGSIVWKSPQGMFSFQHDSELTDAGMILTFDNGTFRANEHALLSSRVAEVDPTSDEEVWTYDGGKTGSERVTFFSSIEGGVQRLGNGNTLITLSTQGTVLEVSPQGEIVWHYTYPPLVNGRAPLLFKVRKYSPEVLPGRP